jgi:hypothetical protein
MATIDEYLGQLEKDNRRLKIEYEQYFGGGRPRPPADTQWRAEQLIKRYSEQAGGMSFAQRFRFNNLVQTYAKYQEVWRKRVKQKEEGVVQRHFGAAAKAIEAERGKAAAAASESGQAPAAGGRTAHGSLFVTACSDPVRETEKVQELYRALVEAKQKIGEKTDTLSPDNFAEFVRRKTEQLKKQKGCKEVEYTIAVEEGQVKLKARTKA